MRGIAWSPAGRGEGTLFVATADGLYKREPGGHFQRVLGGGAYVVSDVQVDPECPAHVYAAFGFDFARPHRGGVAYSADGGGTWVSLTAGTEVHGVPVASIRVAAGDPYRVYAATYGRGAWSFEHERVACE